MDRLCCLDFGRRGAGAILGLLLSVVAFAAYALTFPELTGRVVDDAGILDPSTKAALERKLAEFETKTTGQLVVVTLKSLQGTSIEDYGYQLGRHWQIGQKEKNTGALLIVAPNERKVRIEVGYGFEGTLTDAVSRLIIENSITPRFRANDFAGGIGRGVDDIIQAVSVDSEEWKARARQRPDDEPAFVDILVLMFFLFVFFMILRSVARRDRGYAQTGAGPRRGSRGPILVPIPGPWGSSGASWSGSAGWLSGGGRLLGGGGSFGVGGAWGGWLCDDFRRRQVAPRRRQPTGRGENRRRDFLRHCPRLRRLRAGAHRLGGGGCARRAAVTGLSHGLARRHHLPPAACRICCGCRCTFDADDPVSHCSEKPDAGTRARRSHASVPGRRHPTDRYTYRRIDFRIRRRAVRGNRRRQRNQ